jgi:hypothetical protein
MRPAFVSPSADLRLMHISHCSASTSHPFTNTYKHLESDNQYYAPTDKSRKPCYFVLDRGLHVPGFPGNQGRWRHFGVMMSLRSTVVSTPTTHHVIHSHRDQTTPGDTMARRCVQRGDSEGERYDVPAHLCSAVQVSDENQAVFLREQRDLGPAEFSHPAPHVLTIIHLKSSGPGPAEFLHHRPYSFAPCLRRMSAVSVWPLCSANPKAV